MATTYWQGTKSHDFYDAQNWASGELPQQDNCQEVNISGTAADPAVAIANAPSYTQLKSLVLGDNATLKITAQSDADSPGNVFSAQGFVIYPGSQIIVDTPSAVELGGVSHLAGTLTIMNNNGNVVLDSDRLSGNGTLNLVNSTLGSAGSPINIDEQMNVTLQGGSTLFAGFYADGASITVDPATKNTIVFNGTESTINTALYGVSENTAIGINGQNGAVPSTIKYVNDGNGQYSLVIGMTDGKTLTLSDVHFAAGYTPATGEHLVSDAIKDAQGDYLIPIINGAAANGAPSPDYSVTVEHQQLSATAQSDAAVGGDRSQYSTTPVSNHNSMEQNHFTGTGTASHPADWYNTANWSLGNTPQQEICQQGILQGTADQPLYVTAATASYNQFTSLSVLNDATLTITAPAGVNPSSYVFATQGFEIRGGGTIIVDTSARVELGGVNEIDGTLTIQNNRNNVVLDQGSRLSGSNGTLNLVNSTLGSDVAPVSLNVGTINVSDNSVVYAGFYATGSTVNFDGSNNTFVLNGHESNIGTEFNNVSANTRFAVSQSNGEQPTSAKYSDNGDGSWTLTINMADGKVLKLTDIHLAPGFTPGHSAISNPSDAWVIDTGNGDTCFVEGTRILTEDGEVAVEDLAIGDRLVVRNATETYRAITWVGHRDVVVRQDRSDDLAGYPVRIVKDALAENVPSNDLLVTSEHCLFIDGRFVPVRMLVNGGTIAYDRTVTAYRYFHVETAQHSVIVAENVATESYLDTGNRSSFSAGSVVSLQSRRLSWNDAAAPLATDRAFVESIHARIAERAQALGMTTTAPVTVTFDPQLAVLDQDGRALRILRQVSDKVMIALPEGVQSVRIVSRSARPADVVGPFEDDRRMLGVLVGDVTLWDSEGTKNLRAHLDTAHLAGWHDIESDAMRWTAGDAVLPLGARTAGSVGTLSLSIVAAGPYAIEDIALERLGA